MKALKLFVLPIALLRLSLFAVAILLLALAEALCMLIPINVLRFPIYRTLTYAGCSLALVAMGIASTRDELADYRRLKLPVPKTAGEKVFNAKGGSIIFVNHQGFTDVLLLGLKLSPVFVFPASDGTPVQFSLIGALKRSVSCQQELALSQDGANLDEIAAKAKSSWQPVVVFPEGTRTVGNCVLAWKPRTFEGGSADRYTTPVAILSIQYSKTGAYTPNHTVGTGARHLFWLSMQISAHTAQTMWLPPNQVAAAIKDKTKPEQTAYIRTLLVRMIKDAAEVAIGADIHLEFMSFWDDAQTKGYTQKKRS